MSFTIDWWHLLTTVITFAGALCRRSTTYGHLIEIDAPDAEDGRQGRSHECSPHSCNPRGEISDNMYNYLAFCELHGKLEPKTICRSDDMEFERQEVTSLTLGFTWKQCVSLRPWGKSWGMFFLFGGKEKQNKQQTGAHTSWGLTVMNFNHP